MDHNQYPGINRGNNANEEPLPSSHPTSPTSSSAQNLATSQPHSYLPLSSYEPSQSSHSNPATTQPYNGINPLTVGFGSHSPSDELHTASRLPGVSGSAANRWWPQVPSSQSSSMPHLVANTDSDRLERSASHIGVHSASDNLYPARSSASVSHGGYTSSTEGDVQSSTNSQLTSQAPTPLVGGHSAEPNGDDMTESEVSEYDDHSKLRNAKLRNQSTSTLLSSIGQTLKGDALWGSSTNAYTSVLSGPRARSTKKARWNRLRNLDKSGLSLTPNVASTWKSRKRSGSSWLHPFRMLGSFLAKIFHTFFGPIHPITIIIALVLIASFVASVTKLIIYILNPDKQPLPWRLYCSQQDPFPHDYCDALAPVDVFLGVFSIDSGYERRHLIRSTYAAHEVPLDPHTAMPTANVQVKFIIGKPRKAHARRVALEMEVFNDIVVLDIEENMNHGKTYAYFKWAAENATVPFLKPVTDHGSSSEKAQTINSTDSTNQSVQYQVGWKKADYVVKADDDAYIVLSELERHLRVSPRQMTYWGYLIRNWFMGGECYALSSDLVQYVATSDVIPRYIHGKEDKKVSQWINLHPNRSKIHKVSEHCWIYDHPKAGTAYSHGFLFPDYVEKVKLEARRGLSDQEIQRRGGEHRAKSFSTVSRWHQPYSEPIGGMTIEEEVEALVEGGGRWAGTWVRGEEGNDAEVWVPWDEIVYEANDQRLKSAMTANFTFHAALAEEVTVDPTTGLTIRRTRDHIEQESSSQTTKPERPLAAASTSVEPRALDSGSRLLPHLPIWGFNKPSTTAANSDDERKRSLAATQRRLVPLPTHKDDNGETDQLRRRRYLDRPHGGTVVVHFLKKSEWFYETALAFSGQRKFWADGAGGSGSEWRMYGSPLVRHEDGYISGGRSQPRPDLDMAYLPNARVQAQANAAQAQSQATRLGSFTKPRNSAAQNGPPAKTSSPSAQRDQAGAENR